MKKNIFNTMIVISFILLFIEILLNRTLVFDTISLSLNIWVNNLIPVMFPNFIISNILISYHITNYIPNVINNYISKIFKVNKNLVSIFFLSILSGFPSGARNIRILYDNKLISYKDASKALTFTHFANPLFVLNTVAIIFLNNKNYGYLILVSHYLGNIVIGILFRNYYSTPSINYSNDDNKSQSFSLVLINAIKSSIDTLLVILGTLTAFLIVATIIINRFNINIYASSIIKGILEMTMGLSAISLINISNIYKVIISTMILSFGGLAVHMQVISQLVDTDIEYKPFLLARILHSIISGIICYIGYFIFF